MKKIITTLGILVSLTMFFGVASTKASENKNYQEETISYSEKATQREDVVVPTTYALHNFEEGDFVLYYSNTNSPEPLSGSEMGGITTSISNGQLVEFIEYTGSGATVYANGETFSVSLNDIFPIDSISIPYYEVENDGSMWLYEPINPFITTNSQLEAKEYFSKQFIGYTSSLTPGKKYISTDGVYFYELNNQVTVSNTADTASVEPMFTNAQMLYYTHASVRSTTSLSPSQLDGYIEYQNGQYSGRTNSGSCFYAENDSALMYDKRANDNLLNNSQTTGELFIEAQNVYGINAAFMLSVAMHESCYGFSNYAISRNNFWGWGAIDSDPDAAYGFHSIYEAIPAYAAFLSDYYSDPTMSVANGMQIGDSPVANSGEYCSGTAASKYIWNYDSYEDGIGKSWASGCGWQNSVATYYAKLDSFYNFQDFNDYKFIVVNGDKPVYIKNSNGNLVELTDNAGQPVGNNSTGVQMTYTVIGEETINGIAYYKVLPDTPLKTSYKNNVDPFNVSNDISWRCDDPSDGEHNDGDMMYCTGTTHNDYYNGNDSFYEYELTPNTAWGEYAYSSTQAYYIKKTDVRATFGATSPITPDFGGFTYESIGYSYSVKTNKANVTTVNGNLIPNLGTQFVATDVVYADGSSDIYGVQVIIDTKTQETDIIKKEDLAWDTIPLVVEIENGTSIRSEPTQSGSVISKTPDEVWGNKVVANNVVNGGDNSASGVSCTYGEDNSSWYQISYLTNSNGVITTNSDAYVSGCYSRDVHKVDNGISRGHTEKVSLENNKLHISGFEFVDNYNIPDWNDVSHEIVFKNNSTSEKIIMPLGDTTRTDITKQYGKPTGYNYDKAGFSDINNEGVDLSTLPSGTYTVYIQTTITDKVVKEHKAYYTGSSVSQDTIVNGRKYHLEAINKGAITITVSDVIARGNTEYVSLENNKLHISGFEFIDGYNYANWEDITHNIIFKEKTSGQEYKMPLGDTTRTDITKQYGTPYGYNYDKAGFSDIGGNGVDLSTLPNGTYDIYIETIPTEASAKRHKVYYNGESKSEYGYANGKKYHLDAKKSGTINITVSDAIARGNTEYVSLENNKLHISGFEFIDGYNYANWEDITHNIIFKEKTSGQEYKMPLGDTTRTDITKQYGTPYGYNYDKAGFSDIGGNGVDLSTLQNGTYDVYIETIPTGSPAKRHKVYYNGGSKSQYGYANGKEYHLDAVSGGTITITVQNDN